MAEKPALAPATVQQLNKFPPREFPVIFADGVSVTGRGVGIVKFYLFRTDPSLSADLTSNTVAIAQIVMPADAFAAMTTFFEDQLREMVEKGELTKERVAELRNAYVKKPEARPDVS